MPSMPLRPCTYVGCHALSRTGRDDQQLAEIPTDDFEAALADPVRKPTKRGLIREIRTQEPRIDPDAL